MGRSPCCDKSGLKKGPWTQEEDLKLTQYIQIHGPGNWRTLPKNSGLQRCGKSCRLRWTNYLRPDIKRGRFTFEEEETIIQLHSVLGNKWSAIAARLPGRTDNEIKNYWNTHIRKRLLRNGIDPVTHRPRHDLLDLTSILNSASFNLSNILNIQSLINPQVLRLATLLASSSSSNRQNKELFLNNHIGIAPGSQNPDQQMASYTSTPSRFPSNQLWDQAHNMQVNYSQCFAENMGNLNGQTSHENLVPPCLTDDSIILPNYSDQFTSQASENSSFQLSNTEKNNFNVDSIFPTPISSPTPLDSASMFINGSSTTEDEIESYCRKNFKFEIPESFEFDDFM
ncbi:hypothetical protein L6452_17337 [Arctium lappa]|uniref:Uncharacterized protein n=1 Tax=Arctium lappa TaxID=4217 RepID=A0ACB9C344_ARCLA|nr:hypothetical protein L6452_17337 [Arctium lappa]